MALRRPTPLRKPSPPNPFPPSSSLCQTRLQPLFCMNSRSRNTHHVADRVHHSSDIWPITMSPQHKQHRVTLKSPAPSKLRHQKKILNIRQVQITFLGACPFHGCLSRLVDQQRLKRDAAAVPEAKKWAFSRLESTCGRGGQHLIELVAGARSLARRGGKGRHATLGAGQPSLRLLLQRRCLLGAWRTFPYPAPMAQAYRPEVLVKFRIEGFPS